MSAEEGLGHLLAVLERHHVFVVVGGRGISIYGFLICNDDRDIAMAYARDSCVARELAPALYIGTQTNDPPCGRVMLI